MKLLVASNLWMQTFGGRKLYPTRPDSRVVDIEDIAHALSQICRFGGHTRKPYSVAQHSVLLSYECRREDRVNALLHDAAEAYLGDVVRPFKLQIPWFRPLENRSLRAISRALGVPSIREPRKLVRVHEALLASERRDLLKDVPALDWGLTEKPLLRKVHPWSPAEAKSWFLLRYRQLLRGRR